MVSRDSWHKYREWCFKIVRNIFGELGNNKSSIYTKYPEETILLFVCNTRPRKYSSVTRGESFCCIWSLPGASLVWRTCLPLNIFRPFFYFVFLFSAFSLNSWISSSSTSGNLSAEQFISRSLSTRFCRFWLVMNENSKSWAPFTPRVRV